MNLPTVLSYVGTGGFPLAAVLGVLLFRKIRAEASKMGADAAAVLTQTALESATKSIVAVERRAEKVSVELDKALTEIQNLRDYVEVLLGEVRAAGMPVPPYPPLRIAKEK